MKFGSQWKWESAYPSPSNYWPQTSTSFNVLRSQPFDVISTESCIRKNSWQNYKLCRHISFLKEICQIFFTYGHRESKLTLKKKPSVKPPHTINPEAQRMFNYLPTTCSVKAMFFSINSETLFHKQFMKTQLELRLLKLVYK